MYAWFYIAGLGAGLVAALWYAQRVGLTFWLSLRVFVGLATVGIVGAKLAHALLEAPGHVLSDGTIAQNWMDLFRDDPWHGLRVGDPGNVLLGGVFCALFALLGLSVVLGFDRAGRLGNCLAIGMSLGLSIGRLGCYAAGCCFGQMGFVPVQIAEALFAFVLFAALLLVKKPPPWLMVEIWVLAYGLWRLFIEAFRADVDRGLWWSDRLSSGQIMSLLMLLALGAVQLRPFWKNLG